MITIEQLKYICPAVSLKNLMIYQPILNEQMQLFDVNTNIRIQHFIAQIAHESGQFIYVKELDSGKEYEFRKYLGNVNAGDGVKFKGRGLLQITGRSNYSKLSTYLFGNDILLSKPELLEIPENAVKASLWFWKTKNLNLFADADNLTRITRVINGGLNGFDSRQAFLLRAKKVIL